jgi:hypothetical protein
MILLFLVKTQDVFQQALSTLAPNAASAPAARTVSSAAKQTNATMLFTS